MYTLQIATKPALDAQWYQQLRRLTGPLQETFVMLEMLPEELETRRIDFYASNESKNIDLHPRHVDTEGLQQIARNLTTLRTTIKAQEAHPIIGELYTEYIDRLLRSILLVQHAAMADMPAYMTDNVAIHGMPEYTVYRAVCSWIRRDAQATEAVPGGAIDVLRAGLLELLPVEIGDADMLMPDEKTFRAVRDCHFESGGYYEQLFAPEGMPGEAYVTQSRGDEICRQVIQNVGSDYALIPALDGLWAVLPRSRNVVRPLGYRVDAAYFSGVIGHELGSHLLEEANGSRQSLRLLELGLAGFEAGNEGRAYLREQIIYRTAAESMRQTSWEYILMLHLAVCLAVGMNGQAYTFSQLYQVLYALHRFWRERRYPRDVNNELAARDEAWHLTVRIMKGTDGTGGGYMKDTVYLEGNLRCWSLAARSPRTILTGDCGKFNLTDARQVKQLRQLGIL